MALCSIYRINNVIVRIFCAHFAAKFCNSNKNNSIDFGAIDTFTTQLMQRKSDKWLKINEIRKNINNKQVFSELTTDINNFNQEQLDDFIEKVVCTNDGEKITFVLNQLIKYKMCPSIHTFHTIASYYTQHLDRKSLDCLRTCMHDVNPEQYELNAQFLYYESELLWFNGQIEAALKQFEFIYGHYTVLRRKMNRILRFLISNITTERSEASLVLVIKFVTKLSQQYNDCNLLACVWQICFMSDWYADQCRAAEIFEHNRCLRMHITKHIQFIVYTALRNHQPDIIYRLFEFVLKYGMETHYAFILKALFRYKYDQNDVHSCSEIIRWSKIVDVPLSKKQQEQCTLLLLGKVTELDDPPLPPKDFQFKF